MKVILHLVLSDFRLQNSRIFCVGLSNKCARSLNERSGASVKTESGTGERRRKNYRAFGASCLATSDLETVLQSSFILNKTFRYKRVDTSDLQICILVVIALRGVKCPVN